MMVGQTYMIECSGVGGVPYPELQALVGPDEEIDIVNDLQLEVIDETSDGMLGGTVSRLFEYSPAKDHRFLYVKCLATQENIFDAVYASQRFEVLFPPLPTKTPMETFYIDEGQMATITMVFYANPSPKNSQVIWHIVRQASNQTELIEAGSTRGRYEALQVTVDDTKVTAVLHIYETNYDDILHYCYLEVMNELGRHEYNFALAPRPPMTTEWSNNEEGSNGGGLSIGAIVGIAVGALLLVVAIIIITVYCIKQKPIGKKNKKSKPPMHPGPGDYISVEQVYPSPQVTETIANANGEYVEARDEVDEELEPIGENEADADLASPGNKRDSYMQATASDRYSRENSAQRGPI